MTVRVRASLAVSVSRTSAEEKDLGNLSFETVDDSQGEGGSWKTLLPAGATDQQLFLPNVAAAYMLSVETHPRVPTDDPAAVELKINGVGVDPVTVLPLGSKKQGFFFLTSGVAIAELYASNLGTVDMEVTISVAGD